MVEGSSSYYLAQDRASCHYCPPVGGWVQELLRENLEPIDFFFFQAVGYRRFLQKIWNPQDLVSWVQMTFLKYMTYKTFMTFVGHFVRSLRLYPTGHDCPVIHGFHFYKTPCLCPTGKDSRIPFFKIQAPVPNRAQSGQAPVPNPPCRATGATTNETVHPRFHSNRVQSGHASVPNRDSRRQFHIFAKYLLTNQQVMCYSPER